VSLNPARAVRADWAVGRVGLAIRTGQLRSTCPRPARSQSCFRVDHGTLEVALRASAPRGASSDGLPAPRRLEQPSPCTSPISDVLRRHHGHRPAGSRTDGKLTGRTSCDARLALTRATETTTLPSLAEQQEQRSGCLPSCRNRPGCPDLRTALASMVRKRRATRAPFSPRSRRHVRQYVMWSAPWPASRRRLALRLTGRRHARCVGPTSAISLLRTNTRASLVLDASSACAPAQSRRSPVARQCDSLRRAARISPMGLDLHRGGRCLPVAMCARLASDTPVASPTMPVTLARA